jgi:hypothetical protein
MDIKSLHSVANFKMPLTLDAFKNNVTIGVGDAEALNRLYTIYNNSLSVLISTQKNSSTNYLYYETASISSIDITTGIITFTQNLGYYNYYTVINQAFISLNLISDDHCENYGLDTISDASWLWGETVLTFNDLKYPFSKYS